jgi:hypothetical protein
MLATIFGLFGVTDYDVARRMTIAEYKLRKRGHVMKQLEREQELYLQAFLNRTAQATDKNGKAYVYKTFTDFYDEAKRRQSVLGANYATPVNSDLIAIAKRMKNYKGEEVY